MSCRIVLGVFTFAYALALLLLIVGVFGLFGSERDPLAGVFLIPLGFPWVLWTGHLAESVRPVAAALTPLVNLAVLRGCVGCCEAPERAHDDVPDCCLGARLGRRRPRRLARRCPARTDAVDARAVFQPCRWGLRRAGTRPPMSRQARSAR